MMVLCFTKGQLSVSRQLRVQDQVNTSSSVELIYILLVDIEGNFIHPQVEMNLSQQHSIKTQKQYRENK